MSVRLRCTAAFIVLLCTTFSCRVGADDEAFFESRVRPLLVERCLACHGEKKQQGKLRLDSRAAMLQGGDGTPVIVVGQPKQSRLLQVVRYAEDDTQMPPAGKLPEEEITILQQWIARGAMWPASDEGPTTETDPFPRAADGSIDFEAAAAAHWPIDRSASRLFRPSATSIRPDLRSIDSCSNA